MRSGSDRRRQLTIGAAIVIPAAALAIGVLVPRDHTNPVELEEVVDRFRAGTDAEPVGRSPTATQPGVPTPTEAPEPTDAPAAKAPTVSPTTAPPTPASLTTVLTASAPPHPPILVEPGVYLYRTTGFEAIDALTGVTHHYPPETTITVTPDDCGVLLRWDGLQERREEWRLCASPAGIELQARSLQYHEFFDQETPEDVRCDATITVVPVSDETFEPVAMTCTRGEHPWLPVWEVLESDAREIGDVVIEVRHVRMTIDDNDEHYEHYVADWLLAPSGLPVQLTVAKQSKSTSVVGDVVYDEELLLELVDIEPLH